MKKLAGILAVIAVAVLAALIISDASDSAFTFDFFAMNTYVSGEVRGDDSETTSQEIQNIVETLDTKILSRTAEGSFVYDLNKNGTASLDGEMSAYFSLLAEVCRQSGGAFDFTLGAVSDLWNFGGTPSIPDSIQLADALSHSGYEKIELTGSEITLTDKAAVVDFGASGKGIALDNIRNYLDTRDTDRAVISVGGSVLLYGDDEFTVGIKNPVDGAGRYAAKLTVNQCCVSTSGSYEQYFKENGKIYHHILDPETGYPAESGIVSATVISDSGLLSDALSTACFVLGIEKGFDLADEFGATVIFITDDGGIHIKESADLDIETDSGVFTLVTH